MGEFMHEFSLNNLTFMDTSIRLYDSHSFDRRKIVNEIKSYVSSTHLPAECKMELLDSEFMGNNPSYYVNYPHLFLQDSEATNKKEINVLSVSGYLYYSAIILLDRILDDGIPFLKALSVFLACEEEAIKLLSTIFKIGDPFWKQWNNRKEEYFHAYLAGKSQKINTMQEFEKHADEKSSLGKLAIDALYLMGFIKDEKSYVEILNAHRNFYIAFQILDDISDIKEDYEKSQFNIAIGTIKNAVRKGDIEVCTLADSEKIAESFFSHGYAEELLDVARKKLSLAYKIANKNKLLYFTDEICKLWNTIILQKLNIKAYLYELEVENSLSTKYALSNSLHNAIYNGMQFIAKAQQKAGCWMDFCNNAGVSDTWCTGFITLMLRQAGLGKDLTDKAVKYLKEHKGNDLWGYSSSWIPDNDSSIICSLATDEYENLLNIEDRFNSDGGVPTYYDKRTLLCSLSNTHEWEFDTIGWTQSHLDVSSAALFLFAKAKRRNSHYKKLLHFIKGSIYKRDKLTYWWIDDIYFLFFASLANSIINDVEIYQYIRHATSVKYQVFTQANNKEELTYMYLGMLLHLLLYIGEKDKGTLIKQYIIEHQYDDGSWASSHFMCIPATNNKCPMNTHSFKIADHGIDIRANEFHRLYTTSLILMSLSEYQRL